jgi:hypothetical protein
VDRFVVGDAVPKEMEEGDVMFDTSPAGVGRPGGEMRKGCVKRWDPEALLVASDDQVAPEPEGKFGDDLAGPGPRRAVVSGTDGLVSCFRGLVVKPVMGDPRRLIEPGRSGWAPRDRACRASR